MSDFIFIPARLESIRLPNKLRLKKNNKTVLYHPIHTALEVLKKEFIVLATDSDELAKIGRKYGINVVKTGKYHLNGTSRIKEAIAKLGLNDSDKVVNLQGDVVYLENNIIKWCLDTQNNIIKSGYYLAPIDDVKASNFVKIFTNKKDEALWFSRTNISTIDNIDLCKVHIGIYGYTKQCLLNLPENLPDEYKEEKLEQLAWRYHGYTIKLQETIKSYSIDTQQDYDNWLSINRCTKCKEIKPLSDFSRKQSKKNGFESRCKNCQYECTKNSKIDYSREKQCTKCNRLLKYSEFNKNNYSLDGVSSCCKRCQVLIKYNLTTIDYEKLAEQQNYKCAICNTKEKLHVDHNHKTGKVRALLCTKCNIAIGAFKEDIEILENAKIYLQHHK